MAVRIKVDWNKISEAEHLCMKHIGPRLFYIHNKRGGEGWKIVKSDLDWVLEIEDEKKATFVILKYT